MARKPLPNPATQSHFARAMFEREMRANGSRPSRMRDNVSARDAARLERLIDTLNQRGLANPGQIHEDLERLGWSKTDLTTVGHYLDTRVAAAQAEERADRLIDQWGGVDPMWDRAAELPPIEVEERVAPRVADVDADDLATLRKLVAAGLVPKSTLDRLEKGRTKKTKIGGVRRRRTKDAGASSPRENPGVGALALALPNPAGADSFPPDIEEIRGMAARKKNPQAAEAMALYHSGAASSLGEAWQMVKGGARPNGGRQRKARKPRANISAKRTRALGGYPAAAMSDDQRKKLEKRLADLERAQAKSKAPQRYDRRIKTLKDAVAGEPRIVIVPQPMPLTGSSEPIPYAEETRALLRDYRKALADKTQPRTVTRTSKGKEPATAEQIEDLKKLVSAGLLSERTLDRVRKRRGPTTRQVKVQPSEARLQRLEREIAGIDAALKYGVAPRGVLTRAGAKVPKRAAPSGSAEAMNLAVNIAKTRGGKPNQYLKEAWAVVKGERPAPTLSLERAAASGTPAARKNRRGRKGARKNYALEIPRENPSSNLLAYSVGGLGGFVAGNFAAGIGTKIPLPMGDKLFPALGGALLLWAPGPVGQIPQNWRWGLAGGMFASVLARGLLLNTLGNIPIIGGLLRFGAPMTPVVAPAGMGNVYDAAFGGVGRYLQDDSGLGRYLQDDSGLGRYLQDDSGLGGGDPVWAAPAGGDPVWAAPAGGDPVWAAPAGLDGDEMDVLKEAPEMSDAELAANGMSNYAGANRQVAKVVKVTPVLARKITASGISMGGCACPNQPGAVCVALNRQRLMSGQPKSITHHTPIPTAPARNIASGPSDVDILQYGGLFGESVFGDASALPGIAHAY